jgi:sensor histidine kinase YesM
MWPERILIVAEGSDASEPMNPSNIFTPVSTPAESIFGLTVFVFSIVAVIFVVVFALLAYAVVVTLAYLIPSLVLTARLLASERTRASEVGVG